MDYDIKIYNPQPTSKKFRFTLGTLGDQTLFTIGLNPSTADDHKPDRTVTKVMRFAEKAGYKNFVMLNLYAQRTPYPSELPDQLDEQLHLQNISQIVSELSKHKQPKILAAWGGTINVRPYFFRCLTDIHEATKSLNVDWFRIGGKDLVDNKHPRHPSRATYDRGLEKFDINTYLLTIK